MQSEELTRLMSRCDNWGRWIRGEGGYGAGGCGSIERYYVAPRPDGEQLLRNSVRVDVSDAEKIEAAVCKLRCVGDRKFMKWYYSRNLPERVICAKLRILPALFRPFHLRVLGGLEYRLEQLDRGTTRRVSTVTTCAPAPVGYINPTTI